MISASVTELIDQFAKLPGIGKKSAERLAYHVLRIHEQEAVALANAILAVKQNVHHCKQCYNLAEQDLCAICLDGRRRQDQICIVEQPRDLFALEQAGVYEGLYHVLLGRIAPLENIGPDDLTIGALVERIRRGGISEVILATNPTLEGDGTALYIANCLQDFTLEITRLARGITTGSVLELSNREILADALTGRQKF